MPEPAAAVAATVLDEVTYGIGAVVDVEHHRLGALEQDALAGAARLVQPLPHRLGVGQDAAAPAPAAAPAAPACRRSARPGRPAACCGAAAARPASPPASPARPGRRRGWRGGRPCPRRPGRCRGRWCRSSRRRAPPRAPGRARACSGRISVTFSAMRSVAGDTRSPCAAHLVDLGQQRLGIDHHAVADDAELAAHHAGGQQRQLVGLVADHQRVAGVVAALEAHHDVGAAGEPVDDLALALVAPLGADHRDIRPCHSLRFDSVGRPRQSAQDVACSRAGAASAVAISRPPAPARRRWRSRWPRSAAARRLAGAERHDAARPRLARRRGAQTASG